MLRTVYEDDKFEPSAAPSMARYGRWLPLGRPLDTTARTAVYSAQRLGSRLGLENLWVAFSGWSPPRNATLANGTYKDLEAAAIVGRLDAQETRALVVASAGNTAASLADAATRSGVRVILVVPGIGWRRIATVPHIAKNVCTIVITDGTFDDAQRMAEALSTGPSLVYEGGVRNPARRDAAGSVMLAAADAIGHVPDVYVQATSTGVGILGAYEAALRLIGDGRYGTHVPRLILGQNAPHTPIVNAWSRSLSKLPAEDPDVARNNLMDLRATMLMSQTPAYQIRGGLFDALVATGGSCYGVPNAEILTAMKAFETIENADIDPESAVALCALANAIRADQVKRSDCVLLHLTAAGRRSRSLDNNGLKPTHVVTRSADIASLRNKLDPFLAPTANLMARPWPNR